MTITSDERATPDQILAAAETVFPTLGYDRTTIADLARAAGVTRPTVYAYFHSKADVFRALAESVRDDILTLQERVTGTKADIVRQAVTDYLDIYVRHYGVLTVLSHQALSDPTMDRVRREIHNRANRRHTRFIEALIATGDAHPIAPAPVISEAITGIVMRFAEQIIAAPGRRDELAHHLQTIHLSLIGLSPPSGSIERPV